MGGGETVQKRRREDKGEKKMEREKWEEVGRQSMYGVVKGE